MTHDLVRLALLMERPRSETQKAMFADLTGYAVAARYDDPLWAKREATKLHSSTWLEKTERLLSILVA